MINMGHLFLKPPYTFHTVYIDNFNIIGDGRMNEISVGLKIMFYLSNMLPAFIGAVIIYSPYYNNNCYSLDKWIFISTVSIAVISLIGLFLWIKYLHSLDKEELGGKKKIVQSNEISSLISNYIIAYIASIISISVVGGVRGFALLIFLIVVFGLYAFGWNAMLFNPFLMLKDYRIYWMKLDDGSIGYLILKLTGGPIKELDGHSYNTIKIADYLYYLNDKN